MDTTRLKYLLERHISNTISVSESEELWILLRETDPELQEKLLAEILENITYDRDLNEDRKQVIYDKVITYVSEGQSNPKVIPISNRPFQLFKRYTSIAAVLLVGLAIGVWLWTMNLPNMQNETSLAGTDVDDIYLTQDSLPFILLPDGDTRLLEEGGDNVLTHAGVKLIKDEGGNIVYAVQHQVNLEALSDQKIIFSTPKGHSSKTLLADGTQVWLNSGSSLEYPAIFSATERRVKLIGEGYFDVAHHTEKPFYVETEKGPVIEVLGTSFNVAAYQEEGKTTTTLVEGVVRLLGHNHTMILKPNEQAAGSAHDATWRKQVVNVDDFISWKDGYFSFNARSIEEILAVVKRWYNIENIEFEHYSKERFTGTFKRTKSLKSLLLKLDKISNVKFHIKERRIVVTE